MRKALTALFLVALASAPLRAELKYTMRMEMKKSDTPAANANPMLGMMGEQMMKQMLPNGSTEIVYIVGDKGTRMEFTQAAMGQVAGAVNIAKPDGTMYVLDPQNKTYWKTTAQAASDAMKAAGLAPEVDRRRRRDRARPWPASSATSSRSTGRWRCRFLNPRARACHRTSRRR